MFLNVEPYRNAYEDEPFTFFHVELVNDIRLLTMQKNNLI